MLIKDILVTMLNEKFFWIDEIISIKMWQIILIIIILFFLPVKSFASDCIINDVQHTYDVTPCIYFYEDKSSLLSAEEIIKKDVLKNFYLNTQKGINKGYSASAWWFLILHGFIIFQ